MLLEAGADPNDDESLYHSAENMYLECLDLLLRYGADVSRRSPLWRNTPLYFLLGYREPDAKCAMADEGVRWLLEHGADPNVACEAQAETVLHFAARNNRRSAIVRLLLEHGAQPGICNAAGQTAYALAVRYGNAEAAKALLDAGADPVEAAARDVLLSACAQGDMKEALRLCAEQPGLLESLGQTDRQVLVEAADSGRPAAVRVMLELGFDPATRGRSGATALHLAAFRGDMVTVKAILPFAPPLDARDTDFQATPLGWCSWASVNNPCAHGDYPGVARLLLAAGADFADLAYGAPEVQALARQNQPV